MLTPSAFDQLERSCTSASITATFDKNSQQLLNWNATQALSLLTLSTSGPLKQLSLSVNNVTQITFQGVQFYSPQVITSASSITILSSTFSNPSISFTAADYSLNIIDSSLDNGPNSKTLPSTSSTVTPDSSFVTELTCQEPLRYSPHHNRMNLLDFPNPTVTYFKTDNTTYFCNFATYGLARLDLKCAGTVYNISRYNCDAPKQSCIYTSTSSTTSTIGALPTASTSTTAVPSFTTSTPSTTRQPPPAPISDAPVNQTIQQIPQNKSVPAEAVYNVVSHLLSNLTSSNPISITAPSLSLTAYDTNRPTLSSTTVVQIQKKLEGRDNGSIYQPRDREGEILYYPAQIHVVILKAGYQRSATPLGIQLLASYESMNELESFCSFTSISSINDDLADQVCTIGLSIFTKRIDQPQNYKTVVSLKWWRVKTDIHLDLGNFSVSGLADADLFSQPNTGYTMRLALYLLVVIYGSVSAMQMEATNAAKTDGAGCSVSDKLFQTAEDSAALNNLPRSCLSAILTADSFGTTESLVWNESYPFPSLRLQSTLASIPRPSNIKNVIEVVFDSMNLLPPSSGSSSLDTDASRMIFNSASVGQLNINNNVRAMSLKFWDYQLTNSLSLSFLCSGLTFINTTLSGSDLKCDGSSITLDSVNFSGVTVSAPNIMVQSTTDKRSSFRASTLTSPIGGNITVRDADFFGSTNVPTPKPAGVNGLSRRQTAPRPPATISSGFLSVTNCTMQYSSTSFSLSAVNLTMQSTTVDSCIAPKGAHVINSNFASIRNSVFNNNRADGGSILNVVTSGDITNTTFTSNSVQSGTLQGLSLRLSQCNFTNNAASTSGGAVSVIGYLSDDSSTFSGNSASLGGAIYGDSSIISLNHTQFFSNAASVDGSGHIQGNSVVHLKEAKDKYSMSVDSSTFSDDYVPSIVSSSSSVDFNIANSKFVNLKLDGKSFIMSMGNVTISNVNFDYLIGVSIIDAPSVIIVDSQFNNNQASSAEVLIGMYGLISHTSFSATSAYATTAVLSTGIVNVLSSNFDQYYGTALTCYANCTFFHSSLYLSGANTITLYGNQTSLWVDDSTIFCSLGGKLKSIYLVDEQCGTLTVDEYDCKSMSCQDFCNIVVDGAAYTSVQTAVNNLSRCKRTDATVTVAIPSTEAVYITADALQYVTSSLTLLGNMNQMNITIATVSQVSLVNCNLKGSAVIVGSTDVSIQNSTLSNVQLSFVSSASLKITDGSKLDAVSFNLNQACSGITVSNSALSNINADWACNINLDSVSLSDLTLSTGDFVITSTQGTTSSMTNVNLTGGDVCIVDAEITGSTSVTSDVKIDVIQSKVKSINSKACIFNTTKYLLADHSLFVDISAAGVICANDFDIRDSTFIDNYIVGGDSPAVLTRKRQYTQYAVLSTGDLAIDNCNISYPYNPIDLHGGSCSLTSVDFLQGSSSIDIDTSQVNSFTTNDAGLFCDLQTQYPKFDSIYLSGQCFGTTITKDQYDCNAKQCGSSMVGQTTDSSSTTSSSSSESTSTSSSTESSSTTSSTESSSTTSSTESSSTSSSTESTSSSIESSSTTSSSTTSSTTSSTSSTTSSTTSTSSSTSSSITSSTSSSSTTSSTSSSSTTSSTSSSSTTSSTSSSSTTSSTSSSPTTSSTTSSSTTSSFNTSATTSPPPPPPISDSQAGQQVQVIAATNKTVSADAVYSVMAQLFSNKTSSNPISIIAPSLSLTAYDTTRSTLNSTVVQIQLGSTTDQTTGGTKSTATASISLSLLDALKKSREENQQSAPALVVFMEYGYSSGGFTAEAPANLSAAIYGLSITDADGGAVEVSGSVQKIDIVIPTRGVTTAERLLSVACLYYNVTNNLWQGDGCESQRDFTTFIITCSCNHLTNFTVGTPPIRTQDISDLGNKKVASSNSLPIIIGVVVGCVALIGILAVIAFIVLRRKRTDNEVDMNEIPMESVDASQFVTLEEKIGEGKTSTVYRGLQSGITHIAVKKVPKTTQKKHIHSELNLLKSLHHPNVVQYLSHFNDNSGDIWILLELMEQNLKDKILHFPILNVSVADRYNIMLQIARALSYLESAGIIHTDVSAKNVLIKGEIAKLSGFGDAVRFGQKREEKSDTAPEVMKRREFSYDSDIWSFGVLFWEVMNDGQTPYGHMSEQEIVEYVTDGGRLVSKGDEPHNLIMQRCWKSNPKERMTSKDIVEELQLHCPTLPAKLFQSNKDSMSNSHSVNRQESDNNKLYSFSPELAGNR
ncbi:cell wall surface anchor family protein [Planoprotostelium fungivorum]|uniref:Cell wall surface anchor family protein n=1 Tax=Planoprotostelium fungivorum TaxID=1890364 RepID=A0A2P6MUP8_9EUKA|nr:cell wall surface anchor family protein [Planoprotostelium fungivorum]